MTRAPTHGTASGRTYLALQKKARSEGRPTDELLHLGALEAFLERLVTSPRAADLILKGGVLLAAYDTRRPTRDVDLAGRNMSNTVDATVETIRTILESKLDDGWLFGAPSGETIRDEDQYSGVRVTIPCTLASARFSFHVDVNFGDPIWPAPRAVAMPRLLGGQLTVRGYPLVMVYAEKLITSLQRGPANTRWRDYADLYLLSRRHDILAEELRGALERVAQHRRVVLIALGEALEGYAPIAQARWQQWVRRQRLQDRLPLDFAEVLRAVIAFADPVLEGRSDTVRWDASSQSWRR